MGWLADHAWVVWMVLGVVLAVAEVTILDFTLLMLGIGAIAGGVIALFLPHVFWLQVVVALVVAVSTVGLLRPALQKRMHPPGDLRTGAAMMVGRTGRVTKAIGADESGSVRIGGELWTARAYHDEPIAEGERVEVMTIDGATAMVYPTDQAPIDPVADRIDSELARHASQSDHTSDHPIEDPTEDPADGTDGGPGEGDHTGTTESPHAGGPGEPDGPAQWLDDRTSARAPDADERRDEEHT